MVYLNNGKIVNKLDDTWFDKFGGDTYVEFVMKQNISDFVMLVLTKTHA